MNGRLEGEQKLAVRANKKLINMPKYVSEWVENMRASEETESTINNYINTIRRYLKTISENIVDILPEDLTSGNVTSFLVGLKTIDGVKESSDSYRIGSWYALNSFFEFMVDREYINKNYVKGIKKKKNNDLVRINANRILLTEEDFGNIINAVKTGAGSHRARARQQEWKERDMAIFLIFMTTGVRKTALSQINLNDIDFYNKTLVIRDKGDKRHEFVLSEHTLVAIEKWIQKRNKILNDKETNTEALFISNRGQRMYYETIAALVRKYTETGLGYKISPHKIRAGFCSILYNKNPDLLFVCRVVGHTDTKTTQRYIVTGNADKEKASRIMDNVIAV